MSSAEATCPEWKELEQAMTSVHSVVNGLVDFSKVGAAVRNKVKPLLLCSLIKANLLHIAKTQPCTTTKLEVVAFEIV